MLFLLMVLTIVAAKLPYWLDLEGFRNSPIGSWVNNLIALGIAGVKALLVINIFMGVKFSSKLTRMFVIGGFAWVTLMWLLFADYATRQWEPVNGWEPTAPSGLSRDGDPNH